MVSQVLGILFGWTWPIWAFVFVFSLISAIKKAVQTTDEEEKNPALWPSLWAAGSLAVILGGMISLMVFEIR